MPRQTPDVIALILAVTVGFVVVLTTMALLFQRLMNPSSDPVPTAQAIGQIVAVLVGALVGYMAGRRVNGNGHS